MGFWLSGGSGARRYVASTASSSSRCALRSSLGMEIGSYRLARVALGKSSRAESTACAFSSTLACCFSLTASGKGKLLQTISFE